MSMAIMLKIPVKLKTNKMHKIRINFTEFIYKEMQNDPNFVIFLASLFIYENFH